MGVTPSCEKGGRKEGGGHVACNLNNEGVWIIYLMLLWAPGSKRLAPTQNRHVERLWVDPTTPAGAPAPSPGRVNPRLRIPPHNAAGQAVVRSPSREARRRGGWGLDSALLADARHEHPSEREQRSHNRPLAATDECSLAALVVVCAHTRRHSIDGGPLNQSTPTAHSPRDCASIDPQAFRGRGIRGGLCGGGASLAGGSLDTASASQQPWYVGRWDGWIGWVPGLGGKGARERPTAFLIHCDGVDGRGLGGVSSQIDRGFSLDQSTHPQSRRRRREKGGRAGACCACAMCPSVPPCKDTLTIPRVPTNRRPDRLTSIFTDPTTCLLIQHPTPRQLTQQASYVLYESASGYGLFEVVQHDDIASLTEEVRTGLLALCWLVFTW